MSKILLDYVFPISVIESIPQASTAFLKQACLVVKPKTGQEGNVGQLFTCTSMTQVQARTDNTDAQYLFDAGMSKVLILLADDLDLATYLTTHAGLFYTLLIAGGGGGFTDEDIEEGVQIISPEVKASKKIQDLTFTSKLDGAEGNSISINYNTGATAEAEVVTIANDTEISIQIEDGVSTAQNIADAIEAHSGANALVSVEVDEGDENDPQDAFGAAIPLEGGADEVTDGGDGLDVGPFPGVIGFATDDAAFAADQAALANRCAFFKKMANGARNAFFAFGKLLSNLSNWTNLQYVTMPVNDDVNSLGDANSLFDDKVSFVLNDDEFGNRLGLFAVGGKAIIAPYILKNLRIDLQSRALQWIAQNQPQYTAKEAALLETRLQEDVIENYISVRRWISGGTISISVTPGGNFTATGQIEVPTPNALWRVFNQMTETV